MVFQLCRFGEMSSENVGQTAAVESPSFFLNFDVISVASPAAAIGLALRHVPLRDSGSFTYNVQLYVSKNRAYLAPRRGMGCWMLHIYLLLGPLRPAMFQFMLSIYLG